MIDYTVRQRYCGFYSIPREGDFVWWIGQRLETRFGYIIQVYKTTAYARPIDAMGLIELDKELLFRAVWTFAGPQAHRRRKCT